MALLQISEPGQSTAPHQHRLAAGIDLGTTNSLVATVRSGSADTLPDSAGVHLLPSVVHYGESEINVGESAKAQAAKDPFNTISSVKRFMGRSGAEMQASNAMLRLKLTDTETAAPRILTRSGKLTPVEVSAEILKVLKQRAEQSLGGDLSGVVITVPAYFDDAQRQATKDAAKLAGLKVFRLLNEPTAAAVAYGLDNKAEGVHVIYDLGGGTFDVSILRLNKGVFEVLATAGNSALGGDDFDHVLATWLMDQAGLPADGDEGVLRQVQTEARRAKEALTNSETVDVQLPLPGGEVWRGSLGRDKLNDLIRPLIIQTLLPCRRTLRDAGVELSEIVDVVMVGGSTRVPLVREQVEEFFGRTPLVDIDPDKVVAIGAAMQADVLAGNKPDDQTLLLDVIPLSLGIETMGGLTEKIIHRNTTIPVGMAQEFTTYKDGQTAMSIHVVQGERELVSDCRSLAKFELRGIPPMVAGAARIRVSFQVDADGLLSVAAQELTTGVEASVQIKPSYGLQDTEIEQMLRDSFDFAAVDVDARNLREQQVEAGRVIEALTAALQQDGKQLLSAEEYEQLNAGVVSLAEIAQDSDYRAIKQAMDQLNTASSDFAARRMDASIRGAMAGHTVEEFSK